MAQWCRVFCGLLFAATLAQGSVTVSWNTRPSPRPSSAPARTPIQSGRVAAVEGTRVLVRLRDGSVRTYVATPAQTRLLRGLVGSVIRFRVP
ncbi:MAG TPA: hypothetical protein VFN37_01265 [Candidatus Baltobacteraceae bacterium]|nr:hypothetical protein [Candidatus Baltobacteraceae bacterium]